jgi:hypothetical protein
MTKTVVLHASVSVSSKRRLQEATIEPRLAAPCARAVADTYVGRSRDEHVGNGHGSTPRHPALEWLRGRVAQGAAGTPSLIRSLNRQEDEPRTSVRADRRAEIPRRFPS